MVLVTVQLNYSTLGLGMIPVSALAFISVAFQAAAVRAPEAAFIHLSA
jgi:hypothetical protein